MARFVFKCLHVLPPYKKAMAKQRKVALVKKKASGLNVR